MKCLGCDSENFKEQDNRFTPTIKGEVVDVISPALVCQKCGMEFTTTEQMNELRKKTADCYRRKHGLLTSHEIINFRVALKMSQVEFANYLNVGEASVKRWETYSVQESVQDEHIRLKCDESYAENNALMVSRKNHPADIYSGGREFNVHLFENAVLFFLDTIKSPLYLNKALFYGDFLHYKKYGRSITGTRYVPLDYGPCPDQYRLLYKRLLDNEIIKKSSGHDYVALKKSDLNCFDAKELEILTTIVQLSKNDGGQKLLDLSHKERGFLETSSITDFISYEFAKDLSI